MKKVLITSTSFGKFIKKPLDLLAGKGYEIVTNRFSRPLKEAEMIEEIKDIDGIIVGVDEITDKVLKTGNKLKVVSKYGTGVDNINIEVATKLNIVVTNTPDTNTEAVADLAFGLILALARKIPLADKTTKEKKWERISGVEVYAKTLGIVGLGKIGRAVAKRAKGFNMNILAYDVVVDNKFIKENKITLVSLNELLKSSDFVTIHMPLTKETKNFIGKEQLELMKNGSFIINTSRGGIVDEDVLYKVLKSNKIAGAALDAYTKEPPVDSPFLALDNVITTPHIGAYTMEALEKMGMIAAQNLIDVFEGKRPVYTVNPEAFKKS